MFKHFAILVVGLYLALITLPASADWRESIGVFRVGLVTSGDNALARSKADPFRRAISDKLDIDVEFFPSTSVPAILDALRNDRIEYAILPSTAYSMVNSICKCVEPLVIPRASDSSDSYHLVAISRYGSNLSMSRLPQSKVGLLSADAVIGKNFVRYMLKKDNPGLDLSSLEFQSENSSQQTEEAFSQGDYDVLFGWSSLNGEPSEGFSRGTLRRLIQSKGEQGTAYEVMWKSPSIPHRPHVIRRKLPAEAKSLLRDLMINLYTRNPVAYDSIEPFYSGGFSVARASRFKVLDDFFAQIIADSETTGSVKDETTGE